MTSIVDLFKQDVQYITAPMIHQSDLAFRILTRRYNATITYTQMLTPEMLLYNQEYLEFHLKNMNPLAGGGYYLSEVDLASNRPVVAQLSGNDVQQIVEAGKKIMGNCDGIDLNLGCPLRAAREQHFGSYLLNQKDLPTVANIVSSLARTLPVPISTKIRLCNPTFQTLPYAQRLAEAGSSWITLHARFGQAPNKRRHGSADLSQVKILKDSLDIPVVSNGNVRCHEDIVKNLESTGADGIMVSEHLLDNPCLFANTIPDPTTISLEYLDICRACPEDSVKLDFVQQHIKHFFNLQCSRRTWITKFNRALANCKDLDEVDKLLRFKVQRWRGKPIICQQGIAEPDSESEDADAKDVDLGETYMQF